MPKGIPYKTEEERLEARRAASRKSQAKWRAENPDYNAKYYAKNKEKLNAASRKWQAENRERIRIYNAQFRIENKEKNKEKSNASSARYRAKNKEICNTRSAQWRAKNKEEVQAYKAQYRAERKANNPNCTYKITCVPAEKSYVGMTTVSFEQRKYQHLFHLKTKIHPNLELQAAYDEHGEESLKFEVLREFPPETSRKQMLEYEEEDIIQVIAEDKKIYNNLTSPSADKYFYERKDSQDN